MKRPAKKIAVFPLLSTAIAHAFESLVGAIIIVMALAGATYLIWKIYHIQVPPPPVNAHGDVGVIIDGPYGEEDLALAAYDPDEIGSLTNNPAPAIAPSDPATPLSFAIHYGLTAPYQTLTPWVAGGQLNPTQDDVTASYAVNITTYDGTNLTCTISAGGQLFTFSTTDLNVSNYDTYLAAPVFPVVIERSTDLVGWQPVFTNQVSVGTINQFTDTTGPAGMAFYRIHSP